ncbi:hypothetical protein [Chitinibacter tainanensis]|uniref:hypothetical protein n=1 Tax=Chitinibacter tainanensis TaxID=230667 RepID=UPI0003F86D16|nr:hypothetical protein [Chitinibacter tainanensis]
MSSTAIQNAITRATEILRERMAKEYPSLHKHEELTIEAEYGKVYARLVMVRRDRETGNIYSRSAWGFVRLSDLTLWKAASWKSPAKNASRGLIGDLMDQTRVLQWQYSIH